MALTTDDFVAYLTNHATGAAYPAVGQRDFERAILLVPAEAALVSYDKVARPIWQQIDALDRQHHNLRAHRDLLLPKLVSGEIDVSEAPTAEEVAAA